MPFSNPIAAGLRLIREALRSDNYVPGTSGWTINKDGTAEFSDITARGTLIASELQTATSPTERRLYIGTAGTVIEPSPHVSMWFLRDGDPDSDITDDVATLIQAQGGAGGTRFLSLESGGTYDSRVLAQGHETVPLNSSIQLGSAGHIYADPGQDDAGGRFYLYDNPTALYWPVLSEAHIKTASAACNSSTNLTNANADVPGAVVGFTTSYPNATVMVWGSFDFNTTVAIGANGVCVGALAVDGTDQGSPLAIADAASINRQGASQTWVETLAAAGSHTLKLRARKTINAGSASVLTTQTTISVLILDFP